MHRRGLRPKKTTATQVGAEIKRGEWAQPQSSTREQEEPRSMYSYATASAGSLRKNAAISSANSSSTGVSWRGSGSTARQGPELYSPLWLTSNTQLPRDPATMHAWARAYFALNPVVNNAISLHSTYPISKLNIKCKNKEVENFFATMIDEMELHNACVQMVQEFFVIGECFPYLELDESKLKWTRVIIQNPDYIYVERSVIAGEPQIYLRPDSELRRIITGNDPRSMRARKSIPSNIIELVKKGQNIPIDNFYISHLSRKISPYDTRGTSLIASAFKSLMLWDKLRECKYAQADNMVNPITLVKLGGSVDSEYKITPADLEYWRQLLEEAQYDKDFKIITHGSVAIEKIGSTNVIDINPDLERLMKEIYIALMVPQVIMESGDITYANGGLSLDVLRQRYLQLQNMISKWIRTKVFAPISQLNDFYEHSNGVKKLIIPDVEWNHMSLFDLSDYINFLSGLSTSENRIVSVHSLFRSLGLDYEDEQRMIKKEKAAEAIIRKEEEALNKMSLTELRALDLSDEIPDTVTESSEAAPKEEAPSEGVSFDMPPPQQGAAK